MKTKKKSYHSCFLAVGPELPLAKIPGSAHDFITEVNTMNPREHMGERAHQYCLNIARLSKNIGTRESRLQKS